MVVGEFTQEADLVIIGGGPAGYSAAFRAAELGVQTILVESRKSLGGVCLHEGCIPSKTLLHVAETIHRGGASAQFGVNFSKPRLDFVAMRSWCAKAVDKLAGGLEVLRKKHGLEFIQGQAHFEDGRNIALLDASIPRIRFKRALIATGASPRAHPNVPFDGERVLTPGESLAIDPVPKSLLIVGGDYIAVELALIYSALGAEVTIVNEGKRLLEDADADLARPLIKRLEPQLAGLRLETSIKKVDVTGKSVRVDVDSDALKPQSFDRIVVSAGHVGNTRGLQLEKTKIKVDADGFISVDDRLRTMEPRTFAAGDVTGPPLLADKALHQGRIAAEIISGKSEHSAFDARAIPFAIFTDPQLAWCGLTQAQAESRQIDVRIAKIPWGASGRAVGIGRSDGLTKIIYEPDSQLVLGVGIVGPQACEMIAEGALAVEMGATLTDLAATIHPHPTMSEMISDAARTG